MTTNAGNAVGSRKASNARRSSDRASFWVVQVAPFLLALAAYSAAFLVMRPDATGDEPHYLIAAQSIAFDGDLDLLNDYLSRERTLRAYDSFPLSPHAADYRDSGQLRPVRGIGMATLLAPAVALGGRTGARLLMVLIAALVADQLFRLLRDLGLRRRYGLLAWVAVALCYPMLVFSSQIYPELPAALLIIAVLRVMVKWASSPVALSLGSTAAVLLVWLHVRLIPLSVGLFFGLVIAACRAHPRGAAVRRTPGFLGAVRVGRGELARCTRILTRQWQAVTVPLVIPYFGSLALFAATSYHLYGTVDPRAPYDRYAYTQVESGGWGFLYDFALADLLDPVNGWIPYVPVHWLGLAALGCLVIRWRWVAVACIAVPVGYELILAGSGVTHGWEFPARYLIPVIPLIAVPIALVLQEVRATLVAFVPLLALSLAFALAAVGQHLYLYPAGDKPRVFGARTTAELFPITNPYPFPTSYVLSPGQYGPNTGRLQGGHVVAMPGDPPGYLLFGPNGLLKSGTYRATFELAATGGAPDESVAVVDAISSPPAEVLAGKALTAGDLTERMSNVTLEFSNPNGGLIQTRVLYEGRGSLRAGQVRVEPVHVSAHAPGRLPDWPVAFTWVLGTVAAGWLLVVGMKRAQGDGGSTGRHRAGTTS